MKPIYMDNAASTKVKPEVLARFVDVAEKYYANPSSEHMEGYLAEACINDCKENIANFFNCESDDIFFTSGATMSNNILIQGVLRKKPETMFITSAVEHNDIMELYDWLPYSKHMIQVDRDGFLDYDDLWQQIVNCHESHKPFLVSIQMANSETGVIQPTSFIANLVHKYGGMLHVDATQYIPYYYTDISKMGIDALSMSAQKIGGIKGSGLLVARQVIRNNITPIIFGEQGLIGGTPSTPLIASIDEALSRMDYDGYENYFLEDKRNILLSYLKDMGAVLVGNNDNRLPNNIFCRFPGINGLTLMNLLSERDIYIGTGSACSTDSDKPSHVALAYGLTEEEAFECVRFTLGENNSYEDIEYVAKVLKSILPLL